MSPASLLAAAQLNEPHGAPKLPPLEHVRSHQMYRRRAQDELEEAVWPLEVPDGDKPCFTDPTPVRLRSTASAADAVINFHNKSGLMVRALWVDFGGNEVAYSAIEPNAKKRYRTYASHPWIVREVTTGTRMMLGQRQVVVGSEQEVTVDITLPPRIHWNAETHACFPASFKDSARALLLAHKRMEGAAASAASAPTMKPQPAKVRAAAAEPYGATNADTDAPFAIMSSGATTGAAATAPLKRTLSPAPGDYPPAKAASPNKAASAGAAARSATAASRPASPFAEPAAAGGLASQAAAQTSKPLARAMSLPVRLSGTGGSLSGADRAAPGAARPVAAAPPQSPRKTTVFRSLMSALKHSLLPGSSTDRAPPSSPPKLSRSLSAALRLSGHAPHKAHTQQQQVQQVAMPQLVQGAAVQPCGAAVGAGAVNEAGFEEGPLLGVHLGLLPHHLVLHIVELLSQHHVVLQHLQRPQPIGRADILPALLHGPPPEATPAAAGAAAAADAAAADAGGADDGAEGAEPGLAMGGAFMGGPMGGLVPGPLMNNFMVPAWQQLLGAFQQQFGGAQGHIMPFNQGMAAAEPFEQHVGGAEGFGAAAAENLAAQFGQQLPGWAPLEQGAVLAPPLAAGADVAAVGGDGVAVEGDDDVAALLMQMLVVDQGEEQQGGAHDAAAEE